MAVPTLVEYRKRIPHPSRSEGGRYVRGKSFLRLEADRPVISVVTVVYNGRDGLEETIRSVLSQTYRNVEFIVIDGGSTDGTQDLIRRYDHDIAYWMSEPDEGISDAFNKGLSVIKGDWVMFLNAADTFSTSDSLAVMAQHCGTAPIISGFARSNGKMLPKRALRNSDPIAVRAMLSHQASIVHKSLFDTYGVFDTSFRIRMDYDFWLRVLRRERFLFLDRILVEFAAGGASGSDRKLYLLEELRANKKNLGLFRLVSVSRILFYFERYLSALVIR
jgi:glycosyltransferase involved in cell wall biosynthesis